MAVSRLLADSTTTSRLGREVVSELGGSLRPVDCQTCGRPFGRWERPALTVQAAADTADASLHHRGCRPPQWLEYSPGAEREFTAFPHVTWQAKLILLPTGNTLVFLVNPYYEFAMLRRDNGRWRVSTLDQFAAHGMGTHLFDGVIAQPPLSVLVDEDQISARITDDGSVVHGWRVSPLSADIREVVDAKEWLTIAVTTSLDTRRRLSGNPLPKLINARRVRLGAARIAYTERAQLLRETDFARKVRLEMIALTSEIIERKLGIEVDDGLLEATLACGAGNSALIMRLDDLEKAAAALPVAVLYAARSRTASNRPAHGGGVHVMTAFETEAALWFEMCTAVAGTGNTVAMLAAAPTAEQRRTQYLADIVIGTPEQFRAAYAFYRDDDGDWSLHETRGQLAMTLGIDVRHRAGELIHRYPRVAVV